MSGCKKRAADAAAEADATVAFGDSKRPRTSSRPTFLFCKPNQQVVEVLSHLGRVVAFTDFKYLHIPLAPPERQLRRRQIELARRLGLAASVLHR